MGVLIPVPAWVILRSPYRKTPEREPMFLRHQGVPIVPQSCFSSFFRLPSFTLVILVSLLFVPPFTSAKETDQDLPVSAVGSTFVTVVCNAQKANPSKATQQNDLSKATCVYRVGAGVKNDTVYPYVGSDEGLSHYSEIKVSKKCSDGVETTFQLSSGIFNKYLGTQFDKEFFNAAEKNNIELSRKSNKSDGEYTLMGIEAGYITDEDFLYGGAQNQQKFWHKIFSDSEAISPNGTEINEYEYRPIPSRDNEYYLGGKLGVGKIITIGDIKNCAFVPTGVCADFLQVETGTAVSTYMDYSNIYISAKADKAVFNLFSDEVFLSILGAYDVYTRLKEGRAEQSAFYGLKVDGGTFSVMVGVSEQLGDAQTLWNIKDDKDSQTYIMFDFVC